MELEAAILERVRNWENHSRWERSELGRDLRRQGLSYGEIMEMVPVKKSTLATWCRDIALTPPQIEAMRERRAPQPGYHRDTNRKRRQEIELIQKVARAAVATLVEDPFWVAGVVLYWAEGTKGRNRLSLANADPRAHRLFISWVRRYLTPDAEFTLALHLHEGNDEPAAMTYWRAATGLPEARFIKTFIKPAGTGHRKNHLAHGVCTVRLMRASNAWNTTMEWIVCLATHFGLDPPEN